MDHKLKVTPTKIVGVAVIETSSHRDERGHFYRAFCHHELASILGDRTIQQINISHTKNIGALRGIHFQRAPHEEMKFVRCIKGKVWDVVVDLRQDSKTYLLWLALELSETNYKMFVIPEGCAHGFQALEAESELLYLHTAVYSPTSEGGLRFDEPRIAISWPLPVTDISNRDKSFSFL